MKNCIFCECSDELAPLIRFRYHKKKYYICPEHFPLLIHQPTKLEGKLPNVDSWAARIKPHD